MSKDGMEGFRAPLSEDAMKRIAFGAIAGLAILFTCIVLGSDESDKNKRAMVKENTQLYKIYRCDPIKVECSVHSNLLTKEDCEAFIRAAKKAQPTVERVCTKDNDHE